MSGDIMSFPATPEEFIESYSFRDKEQVYTNGVELIPAFRVKQMIEHYFQTVHGRWIEHPDDRCSLFNGWECSECKQIISGGRCNYCPNCGIPMDGQDTNAPAKSDRGCSTCANDGYDMPQCRECTEHSGYPWYKRRDGGAE